MLADLPQSLLFCGPKGSGKTSAARIVAKSINCQNRDDGEACGKCKNCLAIDSLKASLDIIEMDAASNRGIEEVRGIKERVYSAPVLLTKKVFVIDEVHMMTKEAFNAFLKILEEPPENVYFILCTTNPEKIPETVLSRVLRVDFTKSNQDEMVTSLSKVIKGEGIDLGGDSDVILSEIFDLSEGSFRIGQKILMELVLSEGKKIGLKQWQVFKQSKYASGDYSMTELEADLRGAKLSKILTNLETMAKSGVEMSIYRQKMIEYFQAKMVDLIINQDMEKDGQLYRFQLLLKLLIQAGREEKTAFLPQLPLELAIIDFIDKYKEGPSQVCQKPEKIKEIKAERKKPEAVESNSHQPTNGLKLDEIKAKWKDVLVAVRPYNHSVEAFLRAARPVGIDDKYLYLEVFYKFHKERLEDAKNRKLVERGIEEVFGDKMSFCCRLVSFGTPVDVVAEKSLPSSELYDVAKEIFG